MTISSSPQSGTTEKLTWYEYIEAVHAIIKRGTDEYEATTIRRHFKANQPPQRAAEAVLGNPQLLGG